MHGYSGYTYRKRKQDVKNLLKYRKKIKPSRIKSIKFNKKKVKGLWKYKVLVK